MAIANQRLERAVRLLQLLPAKNRNSAMDFIEWLARENDVDLLLDVEDVGEDLAAAKRFRSGDCTGTVTLQEARRRLQARHV